MTSALLYPSECGQDIAPVLMRAIGEELLAWEEGRRPEREALRRIRVLMKANWSRTRAKKARPAARGGRLKRPTPPSPSPD